VSSKRNWGRIHEAQRSPTKFDVKGQLPDTKKLSGIRSQEISALARLLFFRMA
jgi:hypothetical protein